MASVGQVIKTKDGKRVIDLHLPFGNKERLTLIGNTKKQAGDNLPNFKVFGLYGEVGGVWDKVSKDGTKQYKSMSLESPFGILNFAIFQLEKEEVTDKGTKTHFVVYTTPKPQDNFDNNSATQPEQNNSTNTTPIPEVDIDGEQIPF